MSEKRTLDLRSKKVKVLSDLKFATDFLNMDGRLIIPHRGKVFVVFGENNLANVDRLKKINEPESN